MAYHPKYLAVLALSSAAAIAVGVGCSRAEGEDEGAMASLSPASEASNLVISQIHGGGGNRGAKFKHDYVELFNRGTTPIPLAGKALQYAPKGVAFSAGSNDAGSNDAGSNLLPLPDKSIEPGHYFLVQLQPGQASEGLEFDPPADFAVGGEVGPVGFPLGVTDGKVAIVAIDQPLDGCGGAIRQSADAGAGTAAPEVLPACPTTWIDLVGYGAASQSEGTPVRGASTQKALVRKNDGCTETNDNAADFAPDAPQPRTSRAPKVDCSAVRPPPPVEDGGTEGGLVLLNEILINPPGDNQTPDAPWEFIELACTPSASLDGYWFVAFEGDGDSRAPGAPGVADFVIDLEGKSCGKNGLVLIKSAAGGHDAIDKDTTVIGTPLLDEGGPLENATTSFLVIKSASPIEKGKNYDPNKTGKLELPGAEIIDGVATFDQKEGATDLTYAPRLEQKQGASPDGATRIPGNTKPLQASAWYSADLKKAADPKDPKGLVYDPARSSANFPTEGFQLTPGAANDRAIAGTGQDGDGNRDVNDDNDDEGSPLLNPPGAGGKKKTPEERTTLPPTDTGSRSACAMTDGPATGSGMLAAPFAIGLAIAAVGRRRRK